MAEITNEMQKLLDEVFNADMNLQDFRAWKQSIAEGDKLSAADYMKQKALPDADRIAARKKRIAESQETKTMNEFLDDKFPKEPLGKQLLGQKLNNLNP